MNLQRVGVVGSFNHSETKSKFCLPVFRFSLYLHFEPLSDVLHGNFIYISRSHVSLGPLLVFSSHVNRAAKYIFGRAKNKNQINNNIIANYSKFA